MLVYVHLFNTLTKGLFIAILYWESCRRVSRNWLKHHLLCFHFRGYEDKHFSYQLNSWAHFLICQSIIKLIRDRNTSLDWNEIHCIWMLESIKPVFGSQSLPPLSYMGCTWRTEVLYFSFLFLSSIFLYDLL